jgi:uncharacterized protein (DUF488 family)
MLYSVGHSNHTIEKFINILKKNNIDILVDVRTYPRSKYNPQFNEKALEQSLKNESIIYFWKGRNMGGLGVNKDFEENVKLMVEISKEKNVAVMCSEGDYHKCHRESKINPEVEKHQCKMIHILPNGEIENKLF